MPLTRVVTSATRAGSVMRRNTISQDISRCGTHAASSCPLSLLMLPLYFRENCIIAGAHTSMRWSIESPKNSGAVTPTMVIGTPVTVTVRPTTSGLPPS